MSDSTSIPRLGRHLFGVAAIAFGIITLAWHTYNDWHLPAYIAYVAGAAQILGGVAIQFRAAAKAGSAVLAAIYLFFALHCLPAIIAAPRVYNSWGNFFEQLALFSGPAIVFLSKAPSFSTKTQLGIGRFLLALCSSSFALEQAFYLRNTASLVPKWLPPSQTFWAIATTVFFALAALALLVNQKSLLTARLLTLMLLLFGLLVWLPLLLSDPHSHANWSETIETFAIAGSACILADLLI